MAHVFRIGYYFGELLQAKLPRLEKFIEEYNLLCIKHGLEFSLENADYSDKVQVSDLKEYPYVECFNDLSSINISSGLPEVRKVWEEAKERRNKEQIEINAKAATEAALKKIEKEAVLKQTGITLSDGHYKLVKDN